MHKPYEAPVIEVARGFDDAEEAGWGVVVGAAAIAGYVYWCYRTGGRPTVARWGRWFYIGCN